MKRIQTTLLFAAWVSAIAIATPGCGDEGDEAPDNDAPPTFMDLAGATDMIGGIVWVDSAGSAEHRVELEVRDPNVDRDLVVRWRVMREGELLPEFMQVQLPGTGELMREVTLVVPTDQLAPGQCHRLEAVVSSSFLERRVDPALFDVAVTPTDLDRAIFWLLEGAGPDAVDDGSDRGVHRHLRITAHPWGCRRCPAP